MFLICQAYMANALYISQVLLHGPAHFLCGYLSFWNIGTQTVDANSKCGLTFDLNRFKKISLSINVNVRKIRPTFLFVLFTLAIICSANFSFWSNITPRSFSLPFQL